jgi:hypothetical protein
VACPPCPIQDKPAVKQFLVEAKLVDTSKQKGSADFTIHLVTVEGGTAKIPLDHQMTKSGEPKKWLEFTVKDFCTEGRPVGMIEPNPNPSPTYMGRCPDGTPLAVEPPGPIPMARPACAAMPVVPPAPAMIPPPLPPVEATKRPDGMRVMVVARPMAVPPPAPPIPMAMMPPPHGYYVAPAPSEPMGPGSVIRAVSEEGKNRLEVRSAKYVGYHWQGDDMGAVATMDNVTFKMPGCDSLKMFADHQQVAISCPNFEALADCVTKDPCGNLMLQGHVQLTYHKKDRSVHKVVVDDACLRPSDGYLRFEVNLK